MNGYFTPNEERFFAETDSATIQNAIAAAEADGCREVHIPRYNARADQNEWRISEVIRVPDHFTVILDNCYMVQETGVIANMFANSRYDDAEYITKLENEQCDITILGRGNAICDGGVHNGLLEKTAKRNGYPHMWGNNMFRWINVNGLRMENIEIRNHRWWAICHISSRNIHIKNIHFTVVPHAPTLDGIDFRIGCNNITVENITGRTGDDTVALTVLPGGAAEQKFYVEGKDRDIHDVKIRNIKADPWTYFLVRLLYQDGSKVYNVDIDTLMDTSDYRTKKRPTSAMTIGSSNYYAHDLATRGDLHDLHVRNVTTRANSAIRLSCTVADSTFTNIKTFGDNIHGLNLMDFCDFHNVTIEDFYYGAKQYEIFTGRTIPPEKFQGTVFDLENSSGDLAIRRVKIDKVQRILNVSGPTQLTWGKCECSFANTQVQLSGAARLLREE